MTIETTPNTYYLASLAGGIITIEPTTPHWHLEELEEEGDWMRFDDLDAAIKYASQPLSR